MEWTLPFGAISFAAFVAMLIAYVRTKREIQTLQTQSTQIQAAYSLMKEQQESLQTRCTQLQTKHDALLEEKLRYQARYDALEKTYEKLQEEFEKRSRQLELKLNEIMQKSLDAKIEKFDTASAKKLEEILKPFNENIEQFKQKVEETQEKNIKRFGELTKEIEMLAKHSMEISAQAQNLTEALKGNKQATGAWGEMILDTVLEYSGLVAGEHYQKQVSYRDEETKLKQPDVVIKLPQERYIIVDSKVSLVAYDAYVGAQTQHEQTLAAKRLAHDFKKQIDLLASKDYTRYDIGTLQYVFMFVPIEGAFATALNADAALYEYALRKHVAIVTPSTLTVSLRTIYLYWQSERSNRHALKLFEEAGKLYDKVVTFSQSFRKIGEQLQSLQNSYDKAHNQLASGSANVLKRVENLKKLGAKTTKNLKDTKIEYDDFDESALEIHRIEQKEPPENGDTV